MWLTKFPRRWSGKLASRRRPAGPQSALLQVRELEPRLTPSVVVLASFDTTAGKWPEGSMVLDSGGNLYGAAEEGGGTVGGGGTLFEVAQGSGQITRVAQFGGGAGTHPTGGLIADSSGNLYGTAESGGPSGDGTVFELVHATGVLTRLAAFNGANGASPASGLIMDGSGNLYGTTLYGGTSNDGTVFELAHGSGAVTTLASFDGSDGANPSAGLVMDGSGNLYGTAYNGGAAGYGTVFEVAAGSGAITTLASFDGADGANPATNLALDSAGNLYGVAGHGGASGYGTVFELAKGGGTIAALASLVHANGGSAASNVLLDSRGDLYGTTSDAVIELPSGSSTVVTLASVSNLKVGRIPTGLIADSRGNLYCVGMKATAANVGTVLEIPRGAVSTDQWTGANSGVDTNWSDGANWSLGRPPTAGQTALFTDNSSVKSFTATVDAGFTSAIGGLVIDGTWGGTISVNSPLTVTGNFTLASGSLGGSAAVTISGRASQWTGGQIDVGAGDFTNTGTLTADTSGGNLIVGGPGTFTNDGTFYAGGTNSIVLENSATLDNAAGAVFDLTADGSVSQSGGGTFTNAGTLEKTRGTGTSTIATTTLDNTGTVAVTSGILDISAAVSQVSGRTLDAGTWTVTGTATVHAKLDITSAGRLTTLGGAAVVTLSGTTVAFPNLTALAAIDQGASLSLLDGQSRTTVGALTNAGSLILSPGSTLTVSGSYTQTSSGTLTVQMGGSDAASTVGAVVSTSGTVSLAGSLDVTSTVVPAVGSSLTLLVNEGDSPISGTFAGLPEGGTFTVTVGGTTMTFRISYVGPGTFGDNNVVITRTA